MKKQNTSSLIFSVIVVVLITAGAWMAYSNINNGDENQATAPHIVIEPKTLNWGDISAAAGNVSKQFTVTNTGESDLIINKISTSCGCTTVVLETATHTTSQISMDHGNLPSIKEIIKPQDSAILTVTFDPDFHYVRGSTTRIIYIKSNDPKQREIEIINKMKVVD